MRKETLVLEILRFLPISSRLLGPPKRHPVNTLAWLAAGRSAARRSRLHPIFAPFEGPRTPPKTLNGNLPPWPFDAYYGGPLIQDAAAWVVEIPGGRVACDGAVITPDDRLLADVSRELIVGADQSNHSVLRRRWLRPVRRIPGRVAVLSVTDVNYWHWFFDLLPRILLLQECPGGLENIDTFIVNGFRHRYQAETLARLGVPAAKIVHSHPHRFHIQADVLVVPSVFSEVPARWACEMLRARFTRGGRGQAGRRLYISRADATIRRVVNEDALTAALSKLGFETVMLRGASVAEQAELFSAAEFVVAGHGAGLTNLLFCQPATGVLEIFPPQYITPCYWVLADHLGLDYYYSLGEGCVPPAPPPGANHDEWFWSFLDGSQTAQDVVARIDDVLLILEKALRR